MKFPSRRVLVAAVVLLGIFCVVMRPSLAQLQDHSKAQPQAQSQQDSERKTYADRIRESYNFHFGPNNISTPGNAAIEGNDFIQPGAFPKATYCAVCHEQAYSHWRQALHSNSFRTPFYRTSVNILRRTLR